MERYGSFKVDHKELKPGIYLSRVKMVGSDFIVTLDIRVREPYVDKPLTVMEAHSVEHIMATNLEKDDNKVYFGPMGCMTGFYYVYKVGQNDPDKVAGLLVKAATWDVSEGVPFATEYECGNCHSLAFREKDLRKVKRDMDVIKRLAVDVYTNARFDTYPML